jgi:tetrahydromethanopterin S-methyltransferase subunit G
MPEDDAEIHSILNRLRELEKRVEELENEVFIGEGEEGEED